MQDYNSPYDSPLCKVNPKSLNKRRLQTFIIILYKRLLARACFFTCHPGYLRNMLVSGLCGSYVLSLPSTKSTTYGLHSFSYMASKLWNSRPWVGVRVCHFLLKSFYYEFIDTPIGFSLIDLLSACCIGTAARFPANSCHMSCVELGALCLPR